MQIVTGNPHCIECCIMPRVGIQKRSLNSTNQCKSVHTLLVIPCRSARLPNSVGSLSGWGCRINLSLSHIQTYIKHSVGSTSHSHISKPIYTDSVGSTSLSHISKAIYTDSVGSTSHFHISKPIYADSVGSLKGFGCRINLSLSHIQTYTYGLRRIVERIGL